MHNLQNRLQSAAARRPALDPIDVDWLLRLAPATVLAHAGWTGTAATLRGMPPIDRDALHNTDRLARHQMWLRDTDEDLADLMSLTRGGPDSAVGSTIFVLGAAFVDDVTQVQASLPTAALIESGRTAASLIGRVCYLEICFRIGRRWAALDLSRPGSAAAALQERRPA